MKRLSLISTVLIVMCIGCKEVRPTNLELSNELFDLRKRVTKLEEVAVSNAEVTGLNTDSITNLVKSLDDLVKQIKTILYIIQRNVVSVFDRVGVT